MATLTTPADVATTQHCVYCFDVLISHLTDDSPPAIDFPEASCPLFVTWNTVLRGGHLKLRGCMGTLQPRSLRSALAEYALISSMRDTRFTPIRTNELASLRVTVSLLSKFETAPEWDAWEVGVHGLIIDFRDPELGVKRSATFLPEVAPEQGWGKQQCVDALIKKAGFGGNITGGLRQSLAVTRYQSTAASVLYADYLAMRDEVNVPAYSSR